MALADSWKNTNLLIGVKRRIVGVRLSATDVTWSHGDGPEGAIGSLAVPDPGHDQGRKGAHPDLQGEGVGVLASRP